MLETARRRSTKPDSTMADSQDTVSEGVAAVLTEDQQSVGIDSITTADVDYEEEVDNVQVRHNSRRKRPRADFPWSYTHDWTSGDPVRLRDRRQCVVCKKWFSQATNAQGWKVHLKKQHDVTDIVTTSDTSSRGLADEDGTTSSSQPILRLQQTITKRPLPPHVAHKYENAIIDYVIGGDISLRAAGEPRFQQLVSSLTDGYIPPSTRTIL